MTGTPSRSPPRAACPDRSARPRETAGGSATDRGRACSCPSGSSRLIARNAVGAVNSTLTPCCAQTRQNAPGVRRPDRLAFVEHRRGAVQQRSVDDVAVADGPADVGRRPEDLAGTDAEDVRHAPLQRDRVPAVVAHDALRNAGRARRVVDVERIGGGHGHAVGGLRRAQQRRASRDRARPERRPAPAGAEASRQRSGLCFGRSMA